MDRVKIIAVFVCLFSGYATCTARNRDKNLGHQHSSASMDEGSSPTDIDRKMTEMEARENETMAIMDVCNITFPISLDHLVQLNETGQFPPTATRDSKCYLNCVFTRLGLFDDGNFKKLLTGKAVANKKEDSKRMALYNECIEERDKIEDPCELAYNKISCLIKSALGYYADEQNHNGKGDKM